MCNLFIVLFILFVHLFISVNSSSTVSIPLRKFVDETGARILHEAVSSRSIPNNIPNQFLFSLNKTKVLEEKYKDDKYIQYYTRIDVGKPPQHFDVTFNPAETLQLIPSHAFKKKCKGGFRAYDPRSSHSYVALGETLTMNKTSITAVVATDHLVIGKLNILSQEFGLVQEGNCEKDNVYDGVIGLGFSANHYTLLDNMINQNIVNRSLAALYLDRDVKTVRGGEVTFGGWNPKYLANSSLDYIPIVDSIIAAWQIHLEYAYIGNNQVTFDRFAVIDTKSYFLDLPWFEAEIVAQSIGAFNFHGNLIVPCSTVNELPNLKININEQEYVLHPADYVDKVNSYKGYCMVFIRSTEDDVWTLGGAFLGKYYTIFNYETKMVAFGKLVQTKSNGFNIHGCLWMNIFFILLIIKRENVWQSIF